MTAPRRCIVIPAIKKNAVIPDQLVKRLAGVTLIQRAIDTARSVAEAADIVVVTDSQEIALVCERNGVRHHYNASLRFTSLDIVRELRGVLEELAATYPYLVIYRASCPLLTGHDIDDAFDRFVREGADVLVTVKSIRQRVWEKRDGSLDAILADEGPEDGADDRPEDGPQQDRASGDRPSPSREVYVESKALVMLRAAALAPGATPRVMPYFLNDRAIEINSYQDWWLCEKLLERRHIVFVVAGYPAIGMGHVFRALMLAHEISDHKITFLCTRDSELAVKNIAARDYRTYIQQTDDLATGLAQDVLRLAPDLVVNDILDTDASYMLRLKAAGVRTVNFEDEGPGAAHADLVVNALYEEKHEDPRLLYGHRYFCLRDEFIAGERNPFRPQPRRVLVTFGGTDHSDFTRRTLDIIEPLCRERGITISIVAGPGYAHREAMLAHVDALNSPLVEFTHATNVMSRKMEGADIAICSAGRTVYELAHMRVPAIVMAHHEREARHTFARARNGFAYLGVMHPFREGALRRAFARMLDEDFRRTQHGRMQRLDFTRNKAGVVARIGALLAPAQAGAAPRRPSYIDELPFGPDFDLRTALIEQSASVEGAVPANGGSAASTNTPLSGEPVAPPTSNKSGTPRGPHGDSA
ncbi:NTP transferase domain-containing protein [Nitratidesulfovibrio sp. HK-II]|uniref:cytidylyltransferase domain-containing protein n=1 Tax=Nitratidesulfovibrio sp. HK-II TaxID=2009266 RepID=UPI000E2F1EFA|nr:NTP transferase domain-containing protein [Nitratidesulfovibrio sp. HK-II]GBO97632.1 N-Acetylneuraminate cytidylyltransferase [Nitratidesulfovibrio sp. HK-II]